MVASLAIPFQKAPKVHGLLGDGPEIPGKKNPPFFEHVIRSERCDIAKDCTSSGVKVQRVFVQKLSGKKGKRRKKQTKRTGILSKTASRKPTLFFLNSDKQHVLFSKSSEVKPLGLCLDPPLLYYYI